MNFKFSAEGNKRAEEAKKEGAETPVYCSEELFRGTRSLLIQHGRATYRLMMTRAGKLILTK